MGQGVDVVPMMCCRGLWCSPSASEQHLAVHCGAGEGFVVIVDGARFLPANVTVTKVAVTVFGPDRRALSRPHEVRA